VIFIAVSATFSIQRCYTSLDVMFIYTLDAALILSAESDHVIKFLTSEALCDATVLLEQFTCTFMIYI